MNFFEQEVQDTVTLGVQPLRVPRGATAEDCAAVRDHAGTTVHSWIDLLHSYTQDQLG
jgi:hypothetical protein